jgi:poly(3-hydroxybutyrate) depolymerase/lysophospholipase L1-like esterase
MNKEFVYMKKTTFFKIVMFLCVCIAVAEVANSQTFAYKSHTNASIADYTMPYRLFVPAGYNANTSYPLVLFLHGAGERGTDNNAHITSSRGAGLWAETANQATYPCFVVAPQCPANKQWVNTNWSLGSYSISTVAMSNELKMVKDIIETLQTQYNIDASRLYITGLSMGGYGTWDFIMRYPGLFKAAIPVCGAGDPSKAELISTIPLRVFHSSDDNIVPVSGSRDMVNSIKAIGPNTREKFYTEYTDQGHASWNNAYNTSDLVSWLFTTNAIKVGLTDLTDQPGVITAQGDNMPGQLKGNAFDNNINTSWFDLANAEPTTRASWIQYQLTGGAFVVTEYTITSALDLPERDPKSWSLLGSTNGSEWTTLDTRSNEQFSSRSMKKTFKFANTRLFSYYRLQINSVIDPSIATGVQLAELEIFGTPVVTNISVFPTILNLKKNDISQLNTTVTPSNASNNVTWSSSNEAVATVSSTGLINAVGVGISTITVTSANNNKTASCSVVVGSGIKKYEAEDAARGGGATFHNEDPGYSGTGFVRSFNTNGQYVEFSITEATAGNQDVHLRYTTGSAGSIHVYVNGVKISKLEIPTTGGWSNWKEYAVNVTLNAGNNTIKFQHDADDSGFYYIDCLTVTEAGSGSDTNKVVFMGNSITQFWSSTHPSFFANKPYINKGISGQTTSQMLARFDSDVIKLDPAVVVILGGTNDIAGNGGPTTVKKIMANIASMAQLAKMNGIKVVLCSVLPVYSYNWKPEIKPIDSIVSLNSLIKAYTQENEMIYADFYTPMVGVDKGLKSQYSGDGVHPNIAGYEVMEPIVEEAISKAMVLTGLHTLYGTDDFFGLYPNPVSHESLSLQLPDDVISLSIVDMTGKVVYQEQVIKNELQIARSVFETVGVYIVRVTTKKAIISKRVLVIK